MTKQQSLQSARNVITSKKDANRNELKVAALAAGRDAQAVSKASTMRLAFWVSFGASAI
jgi:hypothetical protein